MSEMPTLADDLVVISKIISVCGICGGMKVYSLTDLSDNLLNYRRWILRRDDGTRQAELVKGCLHGKVLAAKLEGLDDHEEARTFIGYETYIPHDELPSLEEGKYYWHQLGGLKMIDQGGQLLGVTDHLPEAGINDVMVVKPCAGSLDGHEHLLSYTEQCVLSIDPAVGEMQVDWDANF